MLGNEKSSHSFVVFFPLLSSLLVFCGVRRAPREVYRVIALLAPVLTPCALKSALLSYHLISIFIVYQPWGSILAWMLLQMNAITGEASHPDCIEGGGWEDSLVDYRATWGWSASAHKEQATEGTRPPACLPAPSPRSGYWHSSLVLCLISLK